jgi:hypothetical protein
LEASLLQDDNNNLIDKRRDTCIECLFWGSKHYYMA